MSVTPSRYVGMRASKFLRERRARRMGEVPYYEVDSDSGQTYKVFVLNGDAICTCEAGRYRQADPTLPPCTHIVTSLTEEHELG